jgi:hypothetical protein
MGYKYPKKCHSCKIVSPNINGFLTAVFTVTVCVKSAMFDFTVNLKSVIPQDVGGQAPERYEPQGFGFGSV